MPTEAVRVWVRVRPSVAPSIIRVEDSGLTVSYGTPRAKHFAFDGVLGPNVSQDSAYQALKGPNVIDHLMAGYNAAVMAYGQTGSGKTHTMFGPGGGSADELRSAQRGFIPRLIVGLFDALKQAHRDGKSSETSLSVLELYNEQLIDLMRLSRTPLSDAPPLRIREDVAPGGRGVFVEGLLEVNVDSAEAALSALEACQNHRHVGATQMNATSSRSHTIVLVLTRLRDEARGSTTTSQLFLVDLAGSERLGKSGAVGDQVREAQSINLSLTLLGNVIHKLTEGHSKHIPYRDAKLTRLLQEALGGNAMATFIATCSGDEVHESESLSTLGFAQRAKCIVNDVSVNRVQSEAGLKAEIARLLAENASLRHQLQIFDGSAAVVNDNSELAERVCELERLLQHTREDQINSELHVEYLKRQRDDAQSALSSVETRAAAAEALLSKLQSEAKASSAQAKSKILSVPGRRTSQSSDVSRRPSQNVKKGVLGLGRQNGVPEEQPPSTLMAPPLQTEQFLDTKPAAAVDDELTKARAELSTLRKFAVLYDRQIRDMEDLEQRTTKQLADQKKDFESRLATEKSEVMRLNKLLDSDTTPLSRLQCENDALHAENKANASRLLEITRRLDKALSDREAMQDACQRIANSLADRTFSEAQLREQLSLISAERQSERSVFRRRLLECLSRD